MKNTNLFTLQDLVEQGYTADQIASLVKDLVKAKSLQANENKKAEAKKALIAMWHQYCDAIGVETDESGMKFRNDLIDILIGTAETAASGDISKLIGLLAKVTM